MENRHLALVQDWARLYNTDRDRLVDTLYAPNCRVVYNGTLEVLGRQALREFQSRADEHAPHRRVVIDRTHATGDTVVLETVVHIDSATARHSCVVLTFRDGVIVEDHTYADMSPS